MNMMTWESVQQFVRILAGYLAAYLVTRGTLDAETSTVLVGAIVGLAQVGWWVYWNSKRKSS
jgi:hypothetical protein